MSGEPVLHPLGEGELLKLDADAGGAEVRQTRQVLSFLSYREKFLAGSWRFDTYFGRDTLMSLLLLAPVLEPDAIESGLRSVLQRLSDRGEVAHEEAIGEFAILTHLAAGEPADATPIYDYGMIDESFMLAPLAARYLLSDSGRARAAAFLASRAAAGESCGAALVRNFLRVIAATAAFAQHPSAVNLIALKPGHASGDWRDSPDGLDGGRYPYDVNVALVPAALRAVDELLTSGLLDPYLTSATRVTLGRSARQRQVWRRLAAPLYRVRLSAASAREAVRAYARALAIDPQPALAALPSAAVRFEALALDGAGKPLPVMHSDEGFTLLLESPAPEALERIITALLRPFPAGLMTPVGLLVADAAYAGRAAQARFSARAYHGAVVWSWQEALMIAGIDRQLRRGDLSAPLRRQLEQARTALWGVVDAAGALRSSELWSWSYRDGHYQVQPFEAAGVRDESDAAQLWSTVFLALRPSAPH
jgi:glycogen debranching enzyme